MKKVTTRIIAIALGLMLVAGLFVALPMSVSATTVYTDGNGGQPGGTDPGAGGTDPGAGGGDMQMPADGMGGDGEEPPGGFGGGGDMGAGDGGGEGEMAGVTGDGAPSQAAIYISDGVEDTASEYEAGKYSSLISNADGMVVIDGLDINSDDYEFNGLVATGAGSVVKLLNAKFLLSVGSAASDDLTGGNAVNVDNGATLYVTNSELTVDGSARYTTAAYNDAILVVNNSSVISTGSNENTSEVSEPNSNEALLISGNARANFSIGATKTYYFNSTCTAEGWAALSTDSATGNGLDLYAYNTLAVAENGGYSTYADTNCRVWVYGSDFQSAEIGCIISKSGQITVDESGAAPAEVLAYNESGEVDKLSSIIGGRNAVMVHAPDMMGQGKSAADCGTFTMKGGMLGTSSELVSTKDYADYGDAVKAYVDHVTGSVILVKSTSANISLDDVSMESFNGNLVHTVINADSMGNFLQSGDGAQVKPISVNLANMDVTGNILHEDYQRIMNVTLENTTLTGDISATDVDEWNALWKDAGEVNWVVDDSYDSYGVNLTMNAGSVWNVTGSSELDSLTIEEGAVINGEVSVNGEATEIKAGQTYEGEIVVTAGSLPVEGETTAAATVEETTAAPAEQASSGISTTLIIIIIVVVVIIIVLIILIVVMKKKKSTPSDAAEEKKEEPTDAEEKKEETPAEEKEEDKSDNDK